MINILSLQISSWSLMLLAGDLAAFCLAVPFGMLVTGGINENPRFFLEVYRFPIFLVGLTYILVLYVANLYDHYQDFRRHENFSRVILSCLAGTLLAMVLFCYPAWSVIPRNFVEWHAVAFIWLTALWRFSFSATALPRRLQRKALIMGAGRAGRQMAAAIQQQGNSGLGVAGFVDDDPQKAGQTIAGAPVLGNSKEMVELIKQHGVGLVVVAITHEKSTALISNLSRLSFQGVPLTDMPSMYEFLTGKVPTDHISDIWLFLQSLNKRMLYYRHIKRLIDLVLAALLLVLTWPLMLLIGLVIKLESPGPVFYKQERLGQDGLPFQIIKFRSMVQDAENNGPQYATPKDSRITRAGRVLRKLRLDELPQLYNILKGDMSFIGPRPEREVFVRDFLEPVPEFREGRRAGDPLGAQVVCGYRERVPHYSYRLLVKPGVTGWAQVMHQYAATIQETKEKLEFDLYYIKNMGFLLDLAILLKTIRIVLFGRGR
ncbi:MAG: sugar transferase [Deltaproteobacteria bacterium]|nr:sugar transferase [Deltaproteobacteria bacterium]